MEAAPASSTQHTVTCRERTPTPPGEQSVSHSWACGSSPGRAQEPGKAGPHVPTGNQISAWARSPNATRQPRRQVSLPSPPEVIASRRDNYHPTRPSNYPRAGGVERQLPKGWGRWPPEHMLISAPASCEEARPASSSRGDSQAPVHSMQGQALAYRRSTLPSWRL